MSSFKFFTSAPLYDSGKIFYVHINPDISLAKDLMSSFYYSLWFPHGFGFNWDALYDCLGDLEWFPCQKIAIVHRVIPKIPENDLNAYLSVMHDVVIDLAKKGYHDLDVFFSRRR